MAIYLTSYGVDTRYKNYMNSYKDIIEVLKDKRVLIINAIEAYKEKRINDIDIIKVI